MTVLFKKYHLLPGQDLAWTLKCIFVAVWEGEGDDNADGIDRRRREGGEFPKGSSSWQNTVPLQLPSAAYSMHCLRVVASALGI